MNRVQFQAGLSMPELLERYGTEPSCEAALEQARWPAGLRCPRCEGVTYSRVRGRSHALFQCQACRHQTSRIAGTVMQGSKLPLTTCFPAIYLISLAAIGQWAKTHLAPGSTVFCDGLACFAAGGGAACAHQPTVVGKRKPQDLPEFQWINTVLGKLKTSLSGSDHALDFRNDATRYLAAFAYRFKRRFDLRTLHTRRLGAAATCAPQPQRVIRSAEYRC